MTDIRNRRPPAPPSPSPSHIPDNDDDDIENNTPPLLFPSSPTPLPWTRCTTRLHTTLLSPLPTPARPAVTLVLRILVLALGIFAASRVIQGGIVRPVDGVWDVLGPTTTTTNVGRGIVEVLWGLVVLGAWHCLVGVVFLAVVRGEKDEEGLRNLKERVGVLVGGGAAAAVVSFIVLCGRVAWGVLGRFW